MPSWGAMKISQKGLYALQAMMMLARHYNQGAIRIRDIAYEEVLPEKFLELILLELKNARIVESVRGAKGGYQLRRPPSDIQLSEIIRLIDGPLAPLPGLSGGPRCGRQDSGAQDPGRHRQPQVCQSRQAPGEEEERRRQSSAHGGAGKSSAKQRRLTGFYFS